jgi:hypothetical protein
MERNPHKKSEPMGDEARKIFSAVIIAGLLQIGVTYTQLQVMEQKLLGVERSQDLKIDALKAKDDYAAQRLMDVNRSLGELKKVVYTHVGDRELHTGR